MWETFKNLAAVGRSSDDQHLDDKDRECGKQLRSEEAEQSCEYELWCQCGEMGSQPPDANAHLTVVDIQPDESLSSGKTSAGHSATGWPVMTNTVLESYEQQGFQVKLSACKRLGKACCKLQSFQIHGNTWEKLHEFVPCAKLYSDFTEESSIVKNPEVNSCVIPNDVENWDRGHHEGCMCSTVPYKTGFNSPFSVEAHEKSHCREETHGHKQDGKSFTDNILGNLEHRHIEETTSVCKQCGKAFRTNSKST
ncbi:zinc finger protein 709-like [Octodon degus]|uniref:Zinc finger protein 709-like n=1 Tax=Octodon degus TaxID=10160 RepID=A0A6P6ELA8_OCTDE|nr:zinc finger protein 709-like [Octodon degus]